MKLTYRGVQYSEENRHLLTVIAETTSKDIVYRGNSPKGRISSKFPWWGYIKHLLQKSQTRPILDPITFWYNHKREFVEDCWNLNDLEKLNLAWNLTIEIERAKASELRCKTKLKYRGVTYYK